MIALHNLLDGIHVQGWQGPGSPVPGAAGQAVDDPSPGERVLPAVHVARARWCS